MSPSRTSPPQASPAAHQPNPFATPPQTMRQQLSPPITPRLSTEYEPQQDQNPSMSPFSLPPAMPCQEPMQPMHDEIWDSDSDNDHSNHSPHHPFNSPPQNQAHVHNLTPDNILHQSHHQDAIHIHNNNTATNNLRQQPIASESHPQHGNSVNTLPPSSEAQPHSIPNGSQSHSQVQGSASHRSHRNHNPE